MIELSVQLAVMKNSVENVFSLKEEVKCLKEEAVQLRSESHRSNMLFAKSQAYQKKTEQELEEAKEEMKKLREQIAENQSERRCSLNHSIANERFYHGPDSPIQVDTKVLLLTDKYLKLSRWIQISNKSHEPVWVQNTVSELFRLQDGRNMKKGPVLLKNGESCRIELTNSRIKELAKVFLLQILT